MNMRLKNRKNEEIIRLYNILEQLSELYIRALWFYTHFREFII